MTRRPIPSIALSSAPSLDNSGLIQLKKELELESSQTDRLSGYKLRLASTDRPITDDDILERILASILDDYQSTKYYNLRLP